MRHRHRPLMLAGMLLACLAAVAIGGCGASSASRSSASGSSASGSSASGSSAQASSSATTANTLAKVPQPYTKQGPTRQAHETPAASNPDIGGAVSQRNHREAAGGTAATNLGAKVEASAQTQRVDPVGKPHVQAARGTPAQSNDDVNTNTSPGFNPCVLVSLAQAKAITGGRVAASVEAPLGPTCIYQGSGRRDITLTVEAVKLSQVAHGAGKRTETQVRGLPAYCLRLGRPMLFVPLTGGRLLNVTAPCGTAERFAAVAVGRLEA